MCGIRRYDAGPVRRRAPSGVGAPLGARAETSDRRPGCRVSARLGEVLRLSLPYRWGGSTDGTRNDAAAIPA
jgi:hypothetical protein